LSLAVKVLAIGAMGLDVLLGLGDDDPLEGDDPTGMVFTGGAPILVGFRLVAICGTLRGATGAGVAAALGALIPMAVEGAFAATGTPAIFTRISKVVTMFHSSPEETT
jgi:hypothetical protein